MSRVPKAIPALLMIFLFSVLLKSAVAGDWDLTTGFCDIKWGTQLDTLKDLKEVASNPNVSYFTRTEDLYKIYGADLGRVIYGFYQGKFFSAFLDIAGKEKFNTTLNGLNDEFGPPRAQFRVNQDVYIWEIQQIKIKLKHFDNRKIHKLAFYYTPLSNQLNDSQENETEEFVFDLP